MKLQRNIIFIIGLYLGAIVTANLVVAHFGPNATIVCAFLFIGLDLTSRDYLHDAWQRKGLIWKMGVLILAGSIITVILNWGARRIAFASCVAFASAAVIDTITYHLLRDKIRFLRVNGSNVVSAATDSVVFPTIAFGKFMLPIILGQFAAKVFGGMLWFFVLSALPFAKKPSRDRLDVSTDILS